MSITTARPNTLDAWLKRLESVRLSVPQEVKEDVRRALANGNKTVPEIAEVALQSPILSLVLLRESNRSQLGRENPAVSLEVALSRLGWVPLSTCYRHFRRKLKRNTRQPFRSSC